MGESHTRELSLAQRKALVHRQHIGDSWYEVVRVDFTLLVVKEAVEIWTAGDKPKEEEERPENEKLHRLAASLSPSSKNKRVLDSGQTLSAGEFVWYGVTLHLEYVQILAHQATPSLKIWFT